LTTIASPRVLASARSETLRLYGVSGRREREEALTRTRNAGRRLDAAHGIARAEAANQFASARTRLGRVSSASLAGVAEAAPAPSA
jgi:hypothetical protein